MGNSRFDIPLVADYNKQSEAIAIAKNIAGFYKLPRPADAHFKLASAFISLVERNKLVISMIENELKDAGDVEHLFLTTILNVLKEM